MIGGCLRFIGCGIISAIAMPLLVVAAIVVAVMYWNGHHSGWEDALLPDPLKVRHVLYADRDEGLLTDCEYAEYRLPRDVRAAIRRDGLQYFADMPSPPEHLMSFLGSPFGTWHATPVPEDIPALRAAGGCSGKNISGSHPAPSSLHLDKPGAFYSTTGNGEGMMVVDPTRGIAVYLYGG